MILKYILFAICGISATSSLDISGLVSGNRMGSSPLAPLSSPRAPGHGEVDVEGMCARAGLTCQDCGLAVSCMPLPVGWLRVPLQQCTDGETCNAFLGGCSKQPVPECDVTNKEYNHICEQVGVFPDAYDCRKFHFCLPPEEIPQGRPAEHRVAMCPRHYAFNPLTAQCSIKLENGQCRETPIPECKTVGEFGAVPTSPHHYYICTFRTLEKTGRVLHPQILLCPNGWYFYDNFCRPEEPPVKTEKIIEKTKESGLEKKIESREVKKENETQEQKVEEDNHVSRFFSTEKATSYAPDTFLADKYDLSHLPPVDQDYMNQPRSFGDNYGGYDEYGIVD